jgi:Ca-activated chloride channel family protein
MPIMTRICYKAALTLACLMWSGLSVAQTTPNPQVSEEAGDAAQFQLAVEVELVNVTATVLDTQGRYVEGLTVDDFKIFEDGIEQEISFFSHDQRVPVSMGILVDTSGSMRHKLQQALQTARELAMALSPEDEVFVITFSNGSDVLTDFTPTGPDLPQIFRGVRSGGETAAFDAIGLGLEMMEHARHDKKILLLITDGFDTRSRLRAEDIDELLKRSQVLVYAIGIDDDDTDPEVARRTRYHVYHYMLTLLTDVTGGRAFRLYTGRRYALRSLAEVLLEELHQQYTLSYYPSGPTNEDWREIRVNLDRPDATIRHRGGYYLRVPRAGDD